MEPVVEEAAIQLNHESVAKGVARHVFISGQVSGHEFTGVPSEPDFVSPGWLTRAVKGFVSRGLWVSESR